MIWTLIHCCSNVSLLAAELSSPDELSVFKWSGLILGLCSCLRASQVDMMLSWQGNSGFHRPLVVRMMKHSRQGYVWAMFPGCCWYKDGAHVIFLTTTTCCGWILIDLLWCLSVTHVFFITTLTPPMQSLWDYHPVDHLCKLRGFSCVPAHAWGRQ